MKAYVIKFSPKIISSKWGIWRYLWRRHAYIWAKRLVYGMKKPEPLKLKRIKNLKSY